MPSKKKSVKRRSLARRQRDFVFSKQTDFAPVAREQVRGADYLLAQIDPYVKLLQCFDPKKKEKAFFKCLLFFGPTGTGKTYLARYVATAADAEGKGIRFVDARQFPREKPEEPWTREDIRELWTWLRKYVKACGRPIILFWDQFESFTESEDEDALEELYVQIDGLAGRPNGILCIASTTVEPEDFDPQLVRAGRFNANEAVCFEFPRRKGRADILGFYFAQKPHADFDAVSLAYLMHDDTSPADISDIVDAADREAKIRAEKIGEKPVIEKRDLVATLVVHLMGKPGAAADELADEKVLGVAVHEVGHALIARSLRWPIMLASVTPHKGNLGVTCIDYGTPEDTWTLANARDAICDSYGGLYAEKIAGYPKDTGAHSDYQTVTKIAYTLVAELGGGSRMCRKYGHVAVAKRKKSEVMRTDIEHDVGRITKAEEKRAEAILAGIGKEKIVALAKVLAKERVLVRDEFEKLLIRHHIHFKPARVF